MSQHVLTSEANRRQLQQIIAGLSDGVILLDPDQSILWANEAALAMHGASQISDLGSNAKAYVKRFALRYRNNHLVPADSYPISRVARGETFSDVLVEVTSARDKERSWVHRVRSLVLVDSRGKPESLVLIMDDVTDRASSGQLTARELDVLVEVTSAGNEAYTWVHRVRSLVLVDGRGKPESLVLIMDDVTDRASTGQLTARERDVLGLICEGLADKDIAARLKLAPNTVRNHVATVYSKLNVHSRSEAIVWARERGTVLW